MSIEKLTRPSGERGWILTVGPKDEQTFREFYRNFERIEEMLHKNGARKVELHGDLGMHGDASQRHKYVFEGDHNELTRELMRWPWSDSFSWVLWPTSLEALQPAMLPPESKSISIKDDPSALTADSKLDRIEELLVKVSKRLHRLERRSRPKCWEVQVNLIEYARDAGGRYMFDVKEQKAVDIAQEFGGELSHTEDVMVELIFNNRTQAYAAVTALTRAGFSKVGVFPWDEDEIEMLEEDLNEREERKHRESIRATEANATARDTASEVRSPQQESDIEGNAAQRPQAAPGDEQITS